MNSFFQVEQFWYHGHQNSPTRKKDTGVWKSVFKTKVTLLPRENDRHTWDDFSVFHQKKKVKTAVFCSFETAENCSFKTAENCSFTKNNPN